MTRITRIYTESLYDLKIIGNPCHLCCPCSISGYAELALNI